MALKSCRECGGKVSSSATDCPHCGYKLRMNETEKAFAGAVREIARSDGRPGYLYRCVSGLFKIFVAFLIVMAVVSYFSSGKPKPVPPPVLSPAPAEPTPEPAGSTPEAAKEKAPAEVSAKPKYDMNAKALLMLGKRQLSQGKPESARRSYRRVLDQYPGTEQAARASARLNAIPGLLEGDR